MRISKTYILLVLILIFAIILRLPNFFSPLTELHDFRQTQTASNVWLYYKYGFNLFEYHVPMFGGKYWMLEFPLYQIIVYMFTKLLGLNDFVGRLVSLLGFLISYLSLFYISLRLLGKSKYALTSVFLYSIIPINIYFYRSYIPDPFALSISLLVLALSLSLAPKAGLKIMFIYLLILLSAVTKVTIIFSMILPVIYLIYKYFLRQDRKLFISLISILFLLLTIISYLLWHHFAISMNAKSFMLHEGSFRDWFIGMRFTSLEYYLRLSWRFVQELSLAGIMLLFLGLFFLRKVKNGYRKIIGIWILNVSLYLLIFNNLNFIHNYYQLPIYPLTVIIMVYGFIYLRKKITDFRIYGVVLFIFLLLYFAYSSRIYNSFYAPDRGLTKHVFAVSDVVRNCTEDSDKIIYVWPNADPNHPTILYYSKRVGYNLDLFQLGKINNILDYDKEVHKIVIYPVDITYKTPILNFLKNLKSNLSETCFQNNTLILDVI